MLDSMNSSIEGIRIIVTHISQYYGELADVIERYNFENNIKKDVLNELKKTKLNVKENEIFVLYSGGGK